MDVVHQIIDLYEEESGKKIVNGRGEEGTQSTVTTELVSLNGEDDGCETLSLKPGEGGFFKTDRREYDSVVGAILLYLQYYGAIEGVSSDGDMRGEEWNPARALMDKQQPRLGMR